MQTGWYTWIRGDVGRTQAMYQDAVPTKHFTDVFPGLPLFLKVLGLQ